MNIVGKIVEENYVFIIEEFEENLFCHINILFWSSEVYKDMLVKLDAVVKSVVQPLWCVINKTDKQEIKLAKMFGFRSVFENEEQYVMRL